MDKFDDIFESVEPFTDEDRLKIMADTFMKALSVLKDQMMMSDSEQERINRWYTKKAAPVVMAEFLKGMTVDEFDVYLRFLCSPVGKKINQVQIPVNEKVQKMFQLAIPSLMDPLDD